MKNMNLSEVLKKTSFEGSNVFFLIGYVIFLISHIIRDTYSINISDEMFYYSICLWYLFLAFHLIFRYLLVDPKSLVWILLLIAGTILFGMLGSGLELESLLLQTLVLIVVGKDVSFRTIARVTIIVSSICLILIVILSQAGIILDFVDTTEISRTRHGLGFTFVMYPSQLFFMITSLYIYIRKNSIRIIEWLVCGLLARSVYMNVWKKHTFLY